MEKLKNINLSENDYTYVTFDKDETYEICAYGVYSDIISDTIQIFYFPLFQTQIFQFSTLKLCMV